MPPCGGAGTAARDVRALAAAGVLLLQAGAAAAPAGDTVSGSALPLAATAAASAPLAALAGGAASASLADAEQPAAAARFATAAGAFASAPSASSPGGATVVRQPRDFGHVVGDVLTQRVLLRDGERALRAVRLPAADRVGPWLERRAARVETDDAGRHWLAIDYQFVNAPGALTTTRLPALSIATAVARGRAGADADGPSLTVPAWPVSVGPLTPPAGAGDAVALRPDAPVALPSTAAIERRLGASAAALALVLVAWLGWWAWRERREAVRLPFARAERELRRVDPASVATWQSLHRALNASAGRVVPAAGLARWLEERPELRPLQARLEDFYRRSSQRFFEPAAAAADERTAFDLLGLCRALRRAEKRHAR